MEFWKFCFKIVKRFEKQKKVHIFARLKFRNKQYADYSTTRKKRPQDHNQEE